MARRGRPKKSKDQKLRDALDRTAPAEHILERRKMFSFVQPPANKRQDGRNGEIDSEVCDAIGQFQVLGLLDGHGYEAIDLRDRGREWRNLYVRLMRELASHAAGMDMAVDTFKDWQRRVVGGDELTTWERARFERLDGALGSYERKVLMTLLVDPVIGFVDTVPWAAALIAEGLRARGKPMKGYPTPHDRSLKDAAIRGLCQLTEGSLPGRYERRAA